jgi:hypothetical protein
MVYLYQQFDIIMKLEIVLCAEIDNDSLEVLKKMHDVGYAEFRDYEFNNLEEFKNSDEFKSGLRSEDWFLARNFCDQKLLEPLIRTNCIDQDYDAWHTTFIVTDFGKTVLRQISEQQDAKITQV